MFEVGEWPWELIICLQDVLRNDFCEVDEVMFRGVEGLFGLIFYILCFEKSNVDEVA
jgi:hypothetical protein